MGGPKIPQISPGQIIGTALGSFGGVTGKERKFGRQEPLLAGPTSAVEDFLAAISAYAMPIIQGRGAYSPQQVQQQLNLFRAAGAGSGMNRTNPGIFQQGMDLWNLQQQNLQNAVALETGAIQLPLQVEGAKIQDFSALFSPLLDVGQTIAQANQQAAAAQSTAGANKQAGIGSGIARGVGSAVGGYFGGPAGSAAGNKSSGAVVDAAAGAGGQEGGSVPSGLKPLKKKGTDSVHAMLTPGEYVLNRGAVAMFKPEIQAMNEAGKQHPIMAQMGGDVDQKKRSPALPEPIYRLVGGPTDIDGGGGDPEVMVSPENFFNFATGLFPGLGGIGGGMFEPREPWLRQQALWHHRRRLMHPHFRPHLQHAVGGLGQRRV